MAGHASKWAKMTVHGTMEADVLVVTSVKIACPPPTRPALRFVFVEASHSRATCPSLLAYTVSKSRFHRISHRSDFSSQISATASIIISSLTPPSTESASISSITPANAPPGIAHGTDR